MESDYDYWWWNTAKITKYSRIVNNHLKAIGL